MSFNFTWPAFSGEFYENAIQTLNTALNRGPKPKVIAGDIQVKELHMGTVVRRVYSRSLRSSRSSRLAT